MHVSGWLLLGFLALVTAPIARADPLVRPPGLEPEVGFWRGVFTEITTEQAKVHDNRHLHIVYERIELPRSLPEAQRRQARERASRKYENILKSLATGKRSGLTTDEQRVLALWGPGVSNDELRQAASRVRIQMGLSDRFQQGLVRSGQWRDHIRSALRSNGVPEGLQALPHVESSFNPAAGSHAGALGLWQFMPGTGRDYMQVNEVLDERRDPYRSSEAAARLLRHNYAELESWPLAVTAYNHGLGGMRRAAREMGTRDIETIVRSYSGPRFGFASRNFYVSFLAALEVDQDPERYFGSIRMAPPVREAVVVLPDYIGVDALERAFGVPRSTLQAHNPALLATVWQGGKHVPRGYALRLPEEALAAPPSQLLAAVPQAARFGRQVPDASHTVRPGESLSTIARRYNTSTAQLVSLNNLRNQHMIRAGQVLRLPGGPASSPAAAVAAASRPPAAAPAEVYVVRPGDTLGAIAGRTRVPVARLMALNGLADHRIFPGQQLRLRGESTPASLRLAAGARDGDAEVSR
jgi:membrane-bound lytic murein transglycosylase D